MSPVSMRKRGKRRLSQSGVGGNSGRRGPDVDRGVNCHQHHDDADGDDDNGDLH